MRLESDFCGSKSTDFDFVTSAVLDLEHLLKQPLKKSLDDRKIPKAI
jgi:hypothetical protein